MPFLHQRYFWLVLALVLGSVQHGLAQEIDDTDFQTWSDYTSIYRINDKWRYTGDYGIRGVLSGNDGVAVFVRPNFRFSRRPFLSYHGGLGVFFSNGIDLPNIFEIRPWQGLQLLWPKPFSLVFRHYFRLEERFTIRSGDGSDFGLRFRYQIQFKSPNLHLRVLPEHPFYLYSHLEIFMNMGKAVEESFVNRNRLTFGLGNHIAQRWRFEVVYIRQGSRKDSEDGLKTSEHILRFRLKHDIN